MWLIRRGRLCKSGGIGSQVQHAKTDFKTQVDYVFHKKNLYSDIPDVVHLALCCYMNIPLEVTAETLGSVINNHGCKNRSSLLPKTLSNEVQVAWNGIQSSAVSQQHLLKNP